MPHHNVSLLHRLYAWAPRGHHRNTMGHHRGRWSLFFPHLCREKALRGRQCTRNMIKSETNLPAEVRARRVSAVEPLNSPKFIDLELPANYEATMTITVVSYILLMRHIMSHPASFGQTNILDRPTLWTSAARSFSGSPTLKPHDLNSCNQHQLRMGTHRQRVWLEARCPLVN